jgi:APA family basic amino acid/polyamine antiporter
LIKAGAPLAVLGALLALIAGLGNPAWPWRGRRTCRAGSPPSIRASRSPTGPNWSWPRSSASSSALPTSGGHRFFPLGVLIYYLVANLAAFTQTRESRRCPKALQLLGAVACVALVATLPVESVIAGLLMFAAGILYRVLRLRFGTISKL